MNVLLGAGRCLTQVKQDILDVDRCIFNSTLPQKYFMGVAEDNTKYVLKCKAGSHIYFITLISKLPYR